MITDMLGYPITIGCKVATAAYHEGFSVLRISTVVDIVDNALILDNMRRPQTRPGFFVVIGQDPLYNLVKQYEDTKGTNS